MNSRVLNLAIVAAALLLALGLFFKLHSSAPVASSPSAPAAATVNAAGGKTLTTARGARVRFEGSLAGDETAPANDEPSTAPLNTLPPSELALTDVKEYKSENGLTVLVLRDGSKLIVNDFVYQHLPESIRFRLDYQREEER